MSRVLGVDLGTRRIGLAATDPSNTLASPLYAEVSAAPSATVALKIGEDSLDAVRWSDVLKAPLETDKIRIQIVEDGRNWVETVVLDDATAVLRDDPRVREAYLGG